MLMAQRIVKWFTTWSDVEQYLEDIKLECEEHGVYYEEDIAIVDLAIPNESQVESLQYKVILYL